MALSNWDTFALDQDGESTLGAFTSPQGVQVEIYKNWLYLRDPERWTEGGRYVEPTVMEIMDGDFIYRDLRIFARRGPQQGVYAVVHVDGPDRATSMMVGCGVYGWAEADPKHLDEFGSVVTEYRDGRSFYAGTDEPYEPTWDGVLPQSVMFLRAMVTDLTQWWGSYNTESRKNEPLPILALDWLKLTRYNQGDAFFADKLESAELLQSTVPGEAHPTLLSQVVKDPGLDHGGNE